MAGQRPDLTPQNLASSLSVCYLKIWKALQFNMRGAHEEEYRLTVLDPCYQSPCPFLGIILLGPSNLFSDVMEKIFF